MQNENNKINEEWNESSQGGDTLDEADLDQVSGGGHGHGHGKGKGNNDNSTPNTNSGPALGDGSVRFISPTPSITDGTSNTISFGEKK